MHKCSNFGVIFKSHNMNRLMIVVLLTSFMMSCSTVYKSGQTPDDVYFSPAINKSSYVVLEENDEYRSENVPMSDRYLRMKSLGRTRWSAFDEDYAYWNDPHWNNRTYFNNYSNNNLFVYGNRLYGSSYYLNPFNTMYYGQPYIIYNNNVNSASYKVKSSGPRVVNLNNYTPVRVSNYDPKTMKVSSGSTSNYNNNSSSGIPRGGYNPAYNGESNGSPSRTFSNNPSSNSSNKSSPSSSGSSSTPSSSGSAPVRSFPKGGGN